jgi:indoleamine 2,3-dioxygenase
MLEVYKISSQTGFALEKPSPRKFKNEALEPWTDISSQIPTLLIDGSFRSIASSLPILSSDLLEGIEELRLAFVILTFLASAYIWGNIEVDNPSQVLPKSVSVPLLEVAQKLETQPAFCYISGSVWLVTQDENEEEKCICSFTGTKSEEHFNLTTNRVERTGGEALSQALLASRFAGQKNVKETTKTLEDLATILGECKKILASMRDGCDPDVFYFKLRPYLNGSQVSIQLPSISSSRLI